MGAGMMHLDEPGCKPAFLNRDGMQVLDRTADYNTYCAIVAGTVSHMATELITRQYNISDDPFHRLAAAGEACARALQKTNILQDFPTDVARGYCYIPDEWLQTAAYAPLALVGAPAAFNRAVIEDILAELETGAQFILDLPAEAADFRQASMPPHPNAARRSLKPSSTP